MRTLNRPMFNMGGPIKQGIMQGIREPYRGGQLVQPGPGRPGYAGEAAAINAAKWLATLGSRGPKAASVFSNVGKTIGGLGSKISAAIPARLKSWVTGDPLYKTIAGGTTMAGRGAKWTGKKLYGTAKYGLTTPSGLALTAAGTYGLWPDGTPKTDEEIKAQTEGQHGPFDHTDKKKIKKAQAAFAEAQKDTRVKKYLDMMGYDRSKRTAVADALIDASKIVSDRGTLETKNITQELINPIIQATSKRFDKPEQIREAVGLMTMKAEIEKDISKEKDALAKSLTMKKIEQLDRQLDSGVAGKLLTYMAAKKGKVKGDELVDFVRLSANEEGKNFTMVTDEQVQAVPGWENKSAEEVISFIAKDDGIYMMGDTVIEVEGGKPTRIK